MTTSALSLRGISPQLGTLVPQTAHGFTVGNLIYHNGTQYVLALANAAATLARAIVFEIRDVNNFIILFEGTITLLAHGLTIGTTLYLDPVTPGGATDVEPVLPNFPQAVAFVDSVDTIIISIASETLIGTAIHDGVGGEINALALVTPEAVDIVLIEDASDSFSKKRALVSVFGQDYVDDADATEVTTSSATPAVAVSITIGDVTTPTGTFLVTACIVLSSSNFNAIAELSLFNSTDTAELFTRNPAAQQSDQANREIAVLKKTVTLSGTQKLIELRYFRQVGGGGGTITISDARIEAWRVS